jgi:hypothetical protein
MAGIVRNLACGECGSDYAFVENGRTRGPGSFFCQVCGQDIFLWVCEQNIDYDFELVKRGDSLEPPISRTD